MARRRRYSKADRDRALALIPDLGIRGASRRTQISIATLSRWASQPPQKDAPDPDPTADEDESSLTVDQRLDRSIARAQKHLKGAEADHSWTAVARLAARLDLLLAEREERRKQSAAAEAEASAMTEEENRAAHLALIRRMPLDHIDEIYALCVERRGPPALELVKP